ncbi:E3 ubiquitin-protein ligase complex slx8-rfp subunit slx8 [Neodiprion virginianus]|uniref:E3 ubiquitin-protein ligase complex slx8-rfp subunit slx8 n=1 Tax=Neodiprion lecontei TaxID=441921 RepID=A0A6J0BCZ7_NEOLC|nr:E3 ubiquitin-protein ligase complex slx8-rfp subunit slx8 [Neodiprion lecontei]XP_046409569.1 E3 ubiquitin-protein ligase complex slx8-rfp subunit slx8 [Neodiprion fabricii]XP_046466678.1 E3 ubiquitin-protein ligase complex slx8-rfp subunit slx8-like [Neodiprion pinetum]XP_046467663.1 E3 ubiquitin-protein ligase complex slx8-rfp subunit slx8-like [Neodiprion pinetum]XP_046629932.1 E3 ubiquitin-protein ligase complex slx8-rfp subunit slx8 [Neodiprion virginianus]
MSQTTRRQERRVINFVNEQSDNFRRMSELLQNISADIELLQNDTGSKSASSADEFVCLQDLCSSPDFLEEQRAILRDFEMAKPRTAEKNGSPQSERRENHGCSRRSSIGVKLSCPVCLENLSSVKCCNIKMVTECGHIFCKCCIEDICASDEAKGLEPLCPVCREEIGDLRKIYF